MTKKTAIMTRIALLMLTLPATSGSISADVPGACRQSYTMTAETRATRDRLPTAQRADCGREPKIDAV